MGQHLLCVTIDTDPDGLAGQTMNRQTLVWHGLENIHELLDRLEGLRSRWGAIPVTWFVRADGQLRDILGSALYLLEEFGSLWMEVQLAGHELGWHPHLYRHTTVAAAAQLIADPCEAVEELRSLWETLSESDLRMVTFRNGEGWHHSATFSAVESLGFHWDSTAIPGRKGQSGHPMDWVGTPNSPYFPDGSDVRRPGVPRSLLEIPMNTWHVKASYDSVPRLRYMNPAIHHDLFIGALTALGNSFGAGVHVWTFILHPDEVLVRAPADALYSRSAQVACRNLDAFATAIRDAGHEVRFMTMSLAGTEWKRAGIGR